MLRKKKAGKREQGRAGWWDELTEDWLLSVLTWALLLLAYLCTVRFFLDYLFFFFLGGTGQVFIFYLILFLFVVNFDIH